jgi:putative hydrolase of the HAD superfamily
MPTGDGPVAEARLRYHRRIRAVLFDLGNTLVTYYATADFSSVLLRCLQECRDVLGWSQDSERDQVVFVRAMGLNRERPDGAVHALDKRLRELFGEYASLDDATLAAVCEAFLKPIFDLARLDPDALPLLESIRQRGIKTAIVSNTPWGSSASVWRNELARHGLLERVDASVFCGDVGWRKPNPAPFQRALELIHVARADAIFVGDDARWDLIGAQNAGLRPVLLRPSVPVSDGCVGLIAFPTFSTFWTRATHDDPITIGRRSPPGRGQMPRAQVSRPFATGCHRMACRREPESAGMSSLKVFRRTPARSRKPGEAIHSTQVPSA